MCTVCASPLARTEYHGQPVLYCSTRCRSRGFNRRRVADGRLVQQRKAQADRVRAYAKAKPRRAHYPESTQAADARRRARKAGAAVEKFRHAEVFERDGWVCGICTGHVDSSLSYPDPASKSLDHVVPIALGGDHTRANVRLSHLSCNVARGARLEV